MSWIKAFNFRLNISTVDDDEAAGETYCITEPVFDAYPISPLRNGVPFGYTTVEGQLGATRDVGADRRLTGFHYNGVGFGTAIRFDLPAAGQYILKGAFCDLNYDQAANLIQFFDDATLLFANDHTTGFTNSSQRLRDITDALHTPATWIAANGGGARTETFATTILRINIGTTSRQGLISHLHLEQVEGGPSLPLRTGQRSMKLIWT
jgi:hypothetical protein